MVVGRDLETDLAVLEVDDSSGITEAHVARFADSGSVRVGDWVMAIGSPFGYRHTVSVGVVSAAERELDSFNGDRLTAFQRYIQTDAAINPGNSGGPLIDASGFVVGINTAFNPVGPGVAFAIPIDLAGPVASELVRSGFIVRGYLGIVPQHLDDDLAAALGLTDKAGVLIADVKPEGPADRGGVSRGDILISLSGIRTPTVSAYIASLTELSPGRPTEATLVRAGQETKLVVTPEIRPGRIDSEKPEEEPGDILGLDVADRWSLEASRLDAKKNGQGVVITYVSPGGLADQKKLKKGDIILEMGDRSIWRKEEYQEALEEHVTSRPLLMLIQSRGRGTTRFIALSF